VETLISKECFVEIVDLGVRLRARRTAAGQTIAAVAVRAGLSVPYIANLENGRGNPTLTALSALAQALGTALRVELAEPGEQDHAPPAPSASLAKFARLPRFTDAAQRLAAQAGCSVSVQRERLLNAMSAVSAAVPSPMTELDWHRVLDAMILASSSRTG
jgi:transcriptional regulator with XRE-family HTH domain